MTIRKPTPANIAVAIAAITTFGTTCELIVSNYDFEIHTGWFHMVPVWDENEELPERLTR